jgi:hypothetical protein
MYGCCARCEPHVCFGNKNQLVARQAKLSVRPGVILSMLDWRLRAGDALLRGRGLSPRGTRRGLDLREIILRRRLGLRHSSAHKVRRHVGCRRWRCGEISYRAGIDRIGMPRLGRPTRLLVTIGGELGSSVVSATNSSASSAKPTTARKVRTGIAVFQHGPPAL